MRIESEDIPSFRPDIQEVGIHFGWGEKLAPRLGFAYNLFGDDRVKISGSYGRYYDWTKYELARGTFGGDVWTTRYRTPRRSGYLEAEPREPDGPEPVGQPARLLQGQPHPELRRRTSSIRT